MRLVRNFILFCLLRDGIVELLKQCLVMDPDIVRSVGREARLMRLLGRGSVSGSWSRSRVLWGRW